MLVLCRSLRSTRFSILTVSKSPPERLRLGWTLPAAPGAISAKTRWRARVARRRALGVRTVDLQYEFIARCVLRRQTGYWIDFLRARRLIATSDDAL